MQPAATREERLRQMRSRCEARSLVVTATQAAILEAVVDLGTHPTADEVHAAARQCQPGIGRATVYRALESFVRAGVLTKASHTGTAVRYDAEVDRHHHLVCLRCDRILDIADPRLDSVPVPDTKALGFEVSDVQVQLRGTCRTCLQEEENP